MASNTTTASSEPEDLPPPYSPDTNPPVYTYRHIISSSEPTVSRSSISTLFRNSTSSTTPAETPHTTSPNTHQTDTEHDTVSYVIVSTPTTYTTISTSSAAQDARLFDEYLATNGIGPADDVPRPFSAESRNYHSDDTGSEEGNVLPVPVTQAAPVRKRACMGYHEMMQCVMALLGLSVLTLLCLGVFFSVKQLGGLYLEGNGV